jgi:hypothetical protein
MQTTYLYSFSKIGLVAGMYFFKQSDLNQYILKITHKMGNMLCRIQHHLSIDIVMSLVGSIAYLVECLTTELKVRTTTRIGIFYIWKINLGGAYQNFNNLLMQKLYPYEHIRQTELDQMTYV